MDDISVVIFFLLAGGLTTRGNIYRGIYTEAVRMEYQGVDYAWGKGKGALWVFTDADTNMGPANFSLIILNQMLL